MSVSRGPGQELGTVALSVVVPMYNEEQVAPLFLERLRAVLETIGATYEVVCIDDGSTDSTAPVVLGAVQHWPELRLVRLLRNAGHQAALTAGYDAARGDYVVTIDADLQDPPEKIPEMLRVARATQVDVVYGVRRDRSTDSWFKRSTGALYYRVMRRVAGEQVPGNAGDFRLVTRRVVTALTQLPEQGRVHRLVIPWFGFPSAEVTFARRSRAAGATKYPLSKMLALAVESIVSFSAAPLRLATWTGFIGGGVGLAAMLWSLYGWMLGVTVPGWASVLAITGLVGAIQLICLGMLGEYVSRIFSATQGRPTYLVGYDSLHDEARRTPEKVG